MKTKHGLFLENLRLQNFATFQSEEVRFEKEFNAIIGETGSGKSLLLDALQIVFGQRADKKLVRKGAEFAVIEASFRVTDSNVKEYLVRIGHPCDQEEIILKRIISSNGTSKSFLNFQQCPLQTLSDFSKRFIDLVGQFENQKLLNENYQLKLLDHFGALDKDVENFQSQYILLQKKEAEFDDKKKHLDQVKQRQDYLEFQLKELELLDPSELDEKFLIERKDELMSGHQNKEVINNSLNFLSENDEGNVLSYLKQIEKLLSKVNSPILNEPLDKLRESQQTLQDVSFVLSRYSNIEVDEQELESIVSRLDLYMKLKRKFNVDTNGLVSLYQEFSGELQSLSNLESDLSMLENDILVLSKTSRLIALELHKKRIKSSKKLSEQLTQFVRMLKMEGATLRYEIKQSEQMHRYGLSFVNFEAETNPGEGYFKVKETASGGELSRILLAMRQILSSNDTISVFLFDEIDTGVGGETALAIGKALEKVSKDSQVIAITHLPQIAHFGQKLIVVSKETTNEHEGPRTVSFAEMYSGEKKSKYVQGMSQIH